MIVIAFILQWISPTLPLSHASPIASSNQAPLLATQSSILYYHPDHLGSSSMLTDGNGDVVQRMQYYPYGVTISEQRAMSYEQRATSYLYTGQELDAKTSLYYYGARYYDPALGRFLSVDPLQQYLNTYVYTQNNPINRVDPSGSWDWGALWERVEDRAIEGLVGFVENNFTEEERNWFYDQLFGQDPVLYALNDPEGKYPPLSEEFKDNITAIGWQVGTAVLTAFLIPGPADDAARVKAMSDMTKSKALVGSHKGNALVPIRGQSTEIKNFGVFGRIMHCNTCVWKAFKGRMKLIEEGIPKKDIKLVLLQDRVNKKSHLVVVYKNIGTPDMHKYFIRDPGFFTWDQGIMNYDEIAPIYNLFGNKQYGKDLLIFDNPGEFLSATEHLW